MRNNYKVNLDGIYSLVNSNTIKEIDVFNKYIIFPFDIKVGEICSGIFINTPYEFTGKWLDFGIINNISIEVEQIKLFSNDNLYVLERIL